MTKHKGKPPDVRAKTLAVATRLFAQRGLDATALQDIADGVGVRKQSLLHYFANKDELHAAVLESLLARWNEMLPRVVITAPTIRLRLESVVRAALEFFAEDPDRARVLMRELLDRPEEMRRVLRVYNESWVRALCDLIRLGQAEGALRQDLDPEGFVVNAIHVILSGMANHQVMRVLLDGAPSAQRYTAELLRILTAGLLKDRADSAATAP